MELSVFLSRCDLNGYERLAIEFLAGVDAATASTIVKKAMIPQGRIYSVLNGLKEKGIVTAVESSPRQYRIDDIKAALCAFLQKKQDLLESQKEDVQNLSLRSKVSAPHISASVILYHGRDEHLVALADLRNRATREILQIAPIAAGNIETKKALRDALRRGVRHKIITRAITDQNRSFLQECINAGGEVRITDSTDVMSCTIRDGVEILLGVEDYRKEEERLVLRTGNRALINTMKSTFSTLWNQASRADLSPLSKETFK